MLFFFVDCPELTYAKWVSLNQIDVKENPTTAPWFGVVPFSTSFEFE